MSRENKVQEDFARQLEEDLIRLEPDGFQPESLLPKKEKFTRNKNLEKRFLELCLEDYGSRPQSRKHYARIIVRLLICQNVALYVLIAFLVWRHPGQLHDIQALLSVLISGTLVETYFIFNHVIHWLFNEVDYKSFVYPIRNEATHSS